MSNILNHNRNIFDFKLDLSNYWDFHICLDQYGTNGNTNLNNSKFEIVNIDFNNTVIVAPDARGFILGSIIAHEYNLPLIHITPNLDKVYIK